MSLLNPILQKHKTYYYNLRYTLMRHPPDAVHQEVVSPFHFSLKPQTRTFFLYLYKMIVWKKKIYPVHYLIKPLWSDMDWWSANNHISLRSHCVDDLTIWWPVGGRSNNYIPVLGCSNVTGDTHTHTHTLISDFLYYKWVKQGKKWQLHHLAGSWGFENTC